jgi:hypothetical protein
MVKHRGKRQHREMSPATTWASLKWSAWCPQLAHFGPLRIETIRAPWAARIAAILALNVCVAPTATAASDSRAFPDPIPKDTTFETVVNSQPFPAVKYPVPIIGWKAHPEEVHVVPTGALAFPPPNALANTGLYLTPLIGSRPAGTASPTNGAVLMLDPDHVSRRLVDGYLPGVESTWDANGIQVLQLAFCTLLAGTEVRAGNESLVAFTRHKLTNKSDQTRQVTFAFNFGRALRRYPMRKIPPAYHGILTLDKSLVTDSTSGRVVAALLNRQPPNTEISFRPSDASQPTGKNQYTVLNHAEQIISGPEFSIPLTRNRTTVRCAAWSSARGIDLYIQASPIHGVEVAMELEIVSPDGAVRKAGKLFRGGFTPATQPDGEYIPPGSCAEPIRWATLSGLIPEGACTLRLRGYYPKSMGTAFVDSWVPIIYLTEPEVVPEFKHQSGDPEAGSLRFETTLRPRESKTIDLAVPYFQLDRDRSPLLARLKLDEQLALFRRFWTEELNRHAEFIVPEPRIRDSYRACLAYNLILCDRDPATRFLMPHPDGTDYEYVWGGDSGVTIPAMDRLGVFDVTRDCLNWFLARQGQRKPSGEVETQEGFISGDTPPKWMGDNGFILNALARHYWMTGDAGWLRQVAPKMLKACDWIIRERARTKKLENGNKPRHFGLLPKGQPSDLDTWDYWYWTDTYSYLGLRQTADALADIGMTEAASRLAAEADDYKACILDSLDRSINRNVEPPFVPLSPYRNYTPTFENLDRDWYSICGPIYMVEAGLFSAENERATWTHAWLEKLVTTTGLPALGQGQIDPHYVYNTALSHLLRGETDKFVWTFYSLFAYGQSRDTYATLEGQNLLTGSNGDAWDANRQPHMHSNGRVLDMVRIAAVLEDGEKLHLLAGTPRGWLANGQTIEVRRVPTRFGDVSFKAASHSAAKRIEVTIAPPKRKPAEIVLHLRPPSALGPIRSVTVNGKPHYNFDTSSESVRIAPSAAATIKVMAKY